MEPKHGQSGVRYNEAGQEVLSIAIVFVVV
jgi:hypothetical protein